MAPPLFMIMRLGTIAISIFF